MHIDRKEFPAVGVGSKLPLFGKTFIQWASNPGFHIFFDVSLTKRLNIYSRVAQVIWDAMMPIVTLL